MNLNLDGLEAFKDKRPVPRTKAEWAPAGLEGLPDGQVLAVDQSLSSSGLVFLSSLDGTIQVEWAVTYRTGDDGEGAGGHEANLRRALELERLFSNLLETVSGDPTIVHEAPTTGGGKVMRPESSLMAAQALRSAAYRWYLAVAPMVRAQDHKRFTCGQANATKKDHHRALMIWAEGLGIANLSVITNEHLRDALSIALTHLGRDRGE